MEPQTPQASNPLIVPFSIIVAGALIGSGIYLSGSNPERNTLAGNLPSTIETINMRTVSADDHILGNPNAPVIIVEYSDPECPFCKQFHNTMQRVMGEYGADGNVAWVYRHFPIDSLHAKARAESEAMECAGIVGGNQKFWDYTDELYKRTPSNDGLASSEITKIATDVGLNLNDFSACIQSGQAANRVTNDVVDAISSGGQGTPHSILIAPNGEKITIKGAQSYDFMKAIIDAALDQ